MRCFFRFFIFLLFFSLSHALSCALDMYAFDVGVANFVMLVKSQKALIVDCGIAPSGLLQNTSQYKMIKQILDHHHINEARVVFTHDNRDHKQGVLRLLAIFSGRGIQFRCPFLHFFQPVLSTVIAGGEINNSNFSSFSSASHAEHFSFVSRISEDEDYVESIPAQKIFEVLDGCLGSAVHVYSFMRGNSAFGFPFLPSKDWANEGIVFFIEFAGKIILLPGDANGNLLAYCFSNFLNFKDLLVNTNIMMLPHHGSIQNGEQLWTNVVLQNSIEICKYLIVSGQILGGSNSLIKNRHYIPTIEGKLGRPVLYTQTARGGYIRSNISDSGAITIFRGFAPSNEELA